MTPVERTRAFRDALDFEIAVDDQTVVTPPAQLEALSARTSSDESTPPPLVDRLPPAPLSSETIAFADRVRFVLTFYFRWTPAQAEIVVRRARKLMPQGR